MLEHFTNGLLMASLTASVVVGGMTHEAPLGGFVGHSASARAMADKPLNIPTWTDEHAARFAGCAESLPPGVIPSAVIAVGITGDVKRMDFDRAWTVIHEANRADDVDLWIIGACR